NTSPTGSECQDEGASRKPENPGTSGWSGSPPTFVRRQDVEARRPGFLAIGGLTHAEAAILWPAANEPGHEFDGHRQNHDEDDADKQEGHGSVWPRARTCGVTRRRRAWPRHLTT